MPFPVTQDMTSRDFRLEIVDYYWPTLDKAIGETRALASIANRELLSFDYPEIGSFLTQTDKVERFLIPLEKEIRKAILAQTSTHSSFLNFPRTHEAVLPLATSRKHGGAGAHLKAHKVLTNALRRYEAEAGFNHERILNGSYFSDAKEGTLFSAAAKSDSKGNLTRVTEKIPGRELKPEDLKKVRLPQGAPTIAGDLDALAFNPLLKHGYQFKDVGAGAYHGEYTHRLQWYAIGAARSAGAISLFNSPLDIYKSLGYLSAKAPDTTKGGRVPVDSPRQLWMWQALFDTAETETRARELKTLAYQEKSVYTCPESLNKALISSEFLARARYDEDDPSNLWCLRVLLSTRWKKRFDESEGLVLDSKAKQPPWAGVKKVEPKLAAAGVEKVQQKLAARRTDTVVSSASMQKEMKVYEEKKITKKVPTGPATLVGGKLTIPTVTQVEIKRIEKGTAMQTVDTPTLSNAGYALAWYLRNATVV